MRRSTVLTTLAAAAVLACPAAASADSIVYVDQSAVWVAAPDGTQKQQLTPVSSYHSVAQSDDGTIVAARTGGFDVLARNGAVVRKVETAPTRAANGGWHKGTPVNLSISPDGRLVAYEYRDLACAPENPGHCLLESTVMYTTTEGPTATPVETYGKQYNRESPSFLSNDRALIMGGAGSWANIDAVGGGDDSDANWISNTGDIAEGEFSRDGTRFAARFGYDETAALGMYVVNGDPRAGTPTTPTGSDYACGTGEDKKIANPSWAPDNSGIAYESSRGIEVTRLSSFARGSCGIGAQTVLTPTGSQPDWGPADPAAPVVTPDPERQPDTKPPAATAGPPRIATGKVTRAALRKGLRVTVTLSLPARVTIRLANGKRLIAKTTKRATAGTTTVRLPRVRTATLKRLRGRKLSLTATTTAGTTKQALRVRRP